MWKKPDKTWRSHFDFWLKNLVRCFQNLIFWSHVLFRSCWQDKLVVAFAKLISTAHAGQLIEKKLWKPTAFQDVPRYAKMCQVAAERAWKHIWKHQGLVNVVVFWFWVEDRSKAWRLTWQIALCPLICDRSTKPRKRRQAVCSCLFFHRRWGST